MTSSESTDPTMGGVSPMLVAGFIGIFVILLVGPSASAVTLSALCIWALRGPKQAIQAIGLTVVIKFLNPAVYALSDQTGVLAWLVTLFASFRVLPLVNARHLGFLSPLLLFALVVAALSTAVSILPEISLLKLLSFTYVVATVLIAFQALTNEDVGCLKDWVVSLMAAVILMSLPTLLWSDIAYHRNGAGFQGILNHPQSFGALMAPFTAWVLADYLFRRERKSILQAVALSTLVLMIFLAQTRTAFIATILSLIVTYIVVLFARSRAKTTKSAVRTAGTVLAALVVSGTLVAASPVLYDKVEGFVLKRETKSLDEAFYNSRGIGVESQWGSFLKQPLTGFGFGIYPSGWIPVGVTTFLGIPISAPVEKGFLPTAILEEIGIVGTLAFLGFLFPLAKRAIRTRDLRWTSLFFACIFINIGEMVIFSVGGIGLLYWLLIGLSLRAGVSEEDMQTERELPKKNAVVWL